MIFLINNKIWFYYVSTNEKLDSDYLAMSELTKEIGFIVKDSLDEWESDLSPSDIEHILKITSDVTLKIKFQL